MTLPDIHLCVVQPAGHEQALGLLDPARYFRYHFRRLGARVSLSKNRLRHDAVNFVFGAHLGFDEAQCERHPCVFVNLEQFGADGREAGADYLALLGRRAVVDADPTNLAAYAAQPDRIPLVPFVHAPYLADEFDGVPLPLDGRPIELLHLGDFSAAAQAFVARIEDCGVPVSLLDQPLYGTERDAFIRQARAVLLCDAHGSGHVDPVLLAHCLSLGTPVVLQRTAATRVPGYIEQAVSWVDEDTLGTFFSCEFGTPAWVERTTQQHAHFEQLDPAQAMADILVHACGVGLTHLHRRDPQPWRPARLHLGAGTDYRIGWLNLEPGPRGEPDLALDLMQPLALPLAAVSALCGPLRLEAGQCEEIVLPLASIRAAELPTLLTNCLSLLREDGLLTIEGGAQVPDELWTRCTEQFWQLGWFDHRFERHEQDGDAARGRLGLRKVATTPRERTLARRMTIDCHLPEDAVPPQEQLLPAGTSVPLQALVGTPPGPGVDRELAEVLAAA
ncbi:MAG: hypothetical protein RLZZ592_2322 [Pseudomonadota bacterium]|jgi:hypothetical protein